MLQDKYGFLNFSSIKTDQYFRVETKLNKGEVTTDVIMKQQEHENKHFGTKITYEKYTKGKNSKTKHDFKKIERTREFA